MSQSSLLAALTTTLLNSTLKRGHMSLHSNEELQCYTNESLQMSRILDED